MKKYFVLILIIVLSCNQKEHVEEKRIVKKENIAKITDWQEGFNLSHNPKNDSIWGKPVEFYLNNKNCDSTAIKFYFGKYRPTDEPETQRLLNLTPTNNDSLRPFYRWILNKTILIQDGALGEYTGVSARRYAEKYPKEFFEYMDFDKSGEKYLDWTNAILYSGFYDKEDFKDSKQIQTDLIQTMSLNCKNCDEKMKNRIDKFANDCFP
ncbi:hypothetical protein SAMN05421847_2259 [Halpernia humi]|uniref:Lipoprotein n=1 Tax=Halpernia humi TaxID=493375 RepID=A0A1H5ZYM1_9FLAO|nr:hypothetical protein [Halpernia humi]SEG41222.1 hypothetical protein SAMN05421847_2259 [Halpernia humi]